MQEETAHPPAVLPIGRLTHHDRSQDNNQMLIKFRKTVEKLCTETLQAFTYNRASF